MVCGLFCRFWKCENSTRFKCSTKFENARSGTSNKIKLWSFRWEPCKICCFCGCLLHFLKILLFNLFWIFYCCGNNLGYLIYTTASKWSNIYLDLNYFCPCLLDPTQGYEVRWAIAGKSIVTQLVAKLSDGKFWYEKKNLNYIPDELGYLF